MNSKPLHWFLKKNMIYDFMRTIVFFDLPTLTKSERYAYSQFRKWLVSNGYIMLQFSIYCKIFNNREACANHMVLLRRAVPKNGNIRILTVTEKQFASIEIIVGGKSNQEQAATVDSFISL